MRYRLQRHDGTDCSATMVLITVLRMVPIQRYRHHKIVVAVISSIMLYFIVYTFIAFSDTNVWRTYPVVGYHNVILRLSYSCSE